MLDPKLREALRVEQHRRVAAVIAADGDLDKIGRALWDSIVREELLIRSHENFQAKEKCSPCECPETPGTPVPELREPRSTLRAAVVRRARIFRLSKGTLWGLLAGGILALGFTWMASRFVRTLIFLSQ